MMILKISLLLFLTLFSNISSRAIPVDHNSLVIETEDKVQETLKSNQNEQLEAKSNEHTVNLNMNKINRPNKQNQYSNDDLESLLDRLNVFNADDLKKYRENRGSSNSKINYQQQQQQIQPLASQKELENTRLLQSSNDKKPLEKIFSMIARSNFRVRGLIIINNNNNNNNIDEDKFTIDEIIKLLEKRDYIGYQDILEYDKVRRLSAIKAKKADENLKTLKADMPTGEATELAKSDENTETVETTTTATVEDPNTIKNNNHLNDTLVSITMLKAKNDKSKPLQMEFRRTKKGGIIIINNRNNNNNEKIKRTNSYKEPVNITNTNDGVQLPMDKLSKEDIEHLLENSIIVNNDNNNNNIT